MSENVQPTKEEVQDLAKFVYTTTPPDADDPERCVFVFDARRAVTFAHGVHEKLLSKGTEITIYPARSRKDASAVSPVRMKVEYFSPYFNFVVLKTEDGAPTFQNNRPKSPILPRIGTKYTMIGFTRDGVFIKRNSVLAYLGEDTSAYMIGGSAGDESHSGAGLISNGHFLGLAVGRLKCDRAGKNLKERLDLVAQPVPYTCFVTGGFILDSLYSIGGPKLEGIELDEEEEMPSTSEARLTDGEPSTKSYEVQDLAKFLYTTTPPDADGPERCVFVFDERRAVTFAHGRHHEKLLSKGTEITIYPARNPENTENPISEVSPVRMKVECFSKHFDFLVLRTKDDEPTFRENRPEAPVFPHVGINYTMIGIAKYGFFVKRSAVLTYYEKHSSTRMIGGSNNVKGDSGAGMLSNGHFLGLALGRTCFNLAARSTNENICLAAQHVPYTTFVSGHFILDFLHLNESKREDVACDKEGEMPSTSEERSTDGKPPTKISKISKIHGVHEKLLSKGTEITIYPARSRKDASAVSPVRKHVERIDQKRCGSSYWRQLHNDRNYKRGAFIKGNSVLAHLREDSSAYMIERLEISNDHFLGLAVGRLKCNLADKNSKENLDLVAQPVPYTCFVTGGFILDSLYSIGDPKLEGIELDEEEEMPSTSEARLTDGEPSTKIFKM
ncbi:unnamed protein product, partial [Mesorhabditis belari]|uniref:Uncharacterized protein n=1 Tax=Mesorhabditis belari TaxID=2138241 RepID=A0AAF3EL16_9BILA